MHVKWGALGEVFLVGLGVTVAVVVLFALGVTALATRAEALESGAVGAGTVESGAVESGSRGAAPATAVAGLCFGICAVVVAYGIYLIVR